jgi:hypothetical protein
VQPKEINNENIKTTLKLTVGMSTDCKSALSDLGNWLNGKLVFYLGLFGKFEN